jgi:septal ring factor EnvC (AmiA/AmiB activator)
VFAQSRLKFVSTFIALLSCLFLAGCQNMGGGDVDPRLTEGESAKFFSKSGAQACAAGALTGVLACALTNSSNKAACMAIAAVAGCGIGAGANYALDQRRAKFANNEQRINSFIEDVQADNKKLQTRMQNINVVLQENQRTLRTLNAQVAAKQVDQKKAKAELDRINANKAFLEKELANINTRVDEYQDIIEKERAVGADVRQLQGQLDQLSRTRDAMKGQLDVAYGLASSIKVTG